MAFYQMTTDAVDAYNAYGLIDWVGAKLVENGWVSMGVLFDSAPITGTTTSAASSTLTDTTKNWVTNEHVGKYIYVTSGPGASTNRKLVASNTATQITISGGNWPINPALGSGYSIDVPKAVVYKSPSAVNGLPNDFYVTLCALDGSTIRVALHESYNPTTKERDKFAPNTTGSSTGLAVNADYTLATTKSNTLANTTAYSTMVSTSTSTPFRLIVSPSHFILARTNGPSNDHTNIVYVGGFDSFLNSVRDPMPLVLARFYETSPSNYNVTTRDPGAVSSASTCKVTCAKESINATDQFIRYAASNGLLYSVADAGINPWTGVANAGSTQRILLRSGRNFYYPRGVFRDLLITASGTTCGQTMNVDFGSGAPKRYILVVTPGSGTGNSPNVWIQDEV